MCVQEQNELQEDGRASCFWLACCGRCSFLVESFEGFSMPLLQYINPIDIEAYREWDFEVQPSKITLQMEELRDIYAGYVTSWQETVSRMSKETGRYKEFVRVSELHQLLNKALSEGADLELDGHDYVWSFSSGLMFEKRFVSASCPACSRDYLAAECRVEEWAYGSGLAAHGGRRVLCPSGHTLYGCGEWMT